MLAEALDNSSSLERSVSKIIAKTRGDIAPLRSITEEEFDGILIRLYLTRKLTASSTSSWATPVSPANSVDRNPFPLARHAKIASNALVPFMIPTRM